MTVRTLSHSMIAHLVIVALIASWIVDGVVRLREYRRDAHEAAE